MVWTRSILNCFSGLIRWIKTAIISVVIFVQNFWCHVSWNFLNKSLFKINCLLARHTVFQVQILYANGARKTYNYDHKKITVLCYILIGILIKKVRTVRCSEEYNLKFSRESLIHYIIQNNWFWSKQRKPDLSDSARHCMILNPLNI